MPTESFFTQSSLAYIASAGAGKDGKAYSIRPADGTGDFTFSRGSNLAATRVGADGLIEKGRENLLLQSNKFDTTWGLTSSISVTGGQSGYDGSSNAWLLERTGTGGQRLYQNISSSGVQTYSVYAKANVGNWLALYTYTSGGDFLQWYDLSNNGSLGAAGTNIDAKIESIGNGWFKCSVAFVGTTIDVRFYPTDGNGSVSGTNESIFIQDAQLEVGLVSTEYIETTTTTGTAGILENTPRFDYSNGASCPSVLLEPSRTNLITQSEYFGASIYNYTSGITRTANATTSPEGLQNAYLLTEDSSLATHRIGQATWSQSVANTSVSVFAKANGRRYIVLSNANMSPNMSTWFDLQDGVVGTESLDIIAANIEDFGNGWYRCSISYLPSKGNTYPTIYLSNADAASVNYQGDGVSGVYLYGYQIETASYPTSYIPTCGTSVTRVGESMSKDGLADYIGQSTGTFYIEFELPDPNTNSNAMWTSVEQGSNQGTNRALLYTSANSDVLKIDIRANGSSVGISGAAITNLFADTNYKVAVRYESGNVAVYVNGVSEYTSTSTWTYSSDLTKFNFNNQSQAFQGKLKQAMLFTSSLSDAECIALTTI